MITTLLPLIADVVQSVPPDDDSSPAVFFVVLCFSAVCLVLLGIGIAFGLVLAAGAVTLTMFGIVSSSALVALWQRRFSAGLRAFHYQLCAAAAAPGGVALLWFGSGFLAPHLRHRYVLLVGAFAGMLAGLLLAAGLDGLRHFACRRLLLNFRPALSDWTKSHPFDTSSPRQRHPPR